MLGTKVRTKQYEETEGGLGWGGEKGISLSSPTHPYMTFLLSFQFLRLTKA